MELLQGSSSVVSDSLRPHGLQHSGLPCPPFPGACSNSCLLSRWCYTTISYSVILSPSDFNLSQNQGFSELALCISQVAKVLELQLQHQSFQRTFRVDFLYDLLVWSPYSPRDSQESCPTLQFKGINSLALRLPRWLSRQRICLQCRRQNTQVRSLGWEDSLEKEMTTHSSILAWIIPWTEEPSRLKSMGSQRVRHAWATNTHTQPSLWSNAHTHRWLMEKP